MNAMVGKSSISFSHEFLRFCKQIYFDDLGSHLKNPAPYSQGINGFAINAPATYVLTVAAFEALFNEVLLTDLMQMLYQDSPLWKLGSDWIERLELGKKIILVPQMLFGNSYSNNEQPYQDFSILLKVRNSYVHYNMDSKPKFVAPLEQRNIALPSPDPNVTLPNAGIMVGRAWPNELRSTEGIRWAYNTVCGMATTLEDIIKNCADPEPPGIRLISNFTPITLKEVSAWIAENFPEPSK